MSGMCQTWRSGFHCMVEVTINSSMAIYQVSPFKNSARSSPWGMQSPLLGSIEAHFNQHTRYFQKSSKRNCCFSSSDGSKILFFFPSCVLVFSPANVTGAIYHLNRTLGRKKIQKSKKNPN